MALSINSNTLAAQIANSLYKTQQNLATATERLATGQRINSSKDDAAGLAIATRMQAQIGGMRVAERNASDAVSLLQTAEQAAMSMSTILTDMRDLAVQSTNASNSAADRASIDAEYQALSAELDRIASTTTFNGLNITGTDAGAQVFQVGANVGDTLTVTTTDLQTINASAGDVTSVANANTAIGNLDAAINTLGTEIGNYGAGLNRLDHVITNLGVSINAQEAAKGRIMDADMARETSIQANELIKQQAAVAMLGQANQYPQLVLSLLG